jgi:hypothetical protein
MLPGSCRSRRTPGREDSLAVAAVAIGSGRPTAVIKGRALPAWKRTLRFPRIDFDLALTRRIHESPRFDIRWSKRQQ